MQHERICSIHAGTHKTGTTSIQAFLGANEALFAADGILIPRAGRHDLAYGSHHNVAWELNGDPRFEPALGGIDAVGAELAGSEARAACISSEDFELLWNRTDDALLRLRDTVVQAGFAPRVIFYLRPQSGYCESMYAELVKDGFRTPFDEYVVDLLHLKTFRRGMHVGTAFDYAHLIDAFAAAFGPTGGVVRAFHRDAPDDALLHEFAASLRGEHGEPLRYAVSRRLNAGLTFDAVLRILGSPAGTDPGLPFAPLTPAQRARIAVRFLPSNLDVRGRYGVFVPPSDVALTACADPGTPLYTARKVLAGAA